MSCNGGLAFRHVVSKYFKMPQEIIFIISLSEWDIIPTSYSFP